MQHRIKLFYHRNKKPYYRFVTQDEIIHIDKTLKQYIADQKLQSGKYDHATEGERLMGSIYFMRNKLLAEWYRDEYPVDKLDLFKSGNKYPYIGSFDRLKYNIAEEDFWWATFIAELYFVFLKDGKKATKLEIMLWISCINLRSNDEYVGGFRDVLDTVYFQKSKNDKGEIVYNVNLGAFYHWLIPA